MPIASSDASCTSTRGSGVVGDEQNAVPGGTQLGDPLDRTGNWLMGQPDDSVEVAQHDTSFAYNRWTIDVVDALIHIWPCWHARCQPVWVPRFEPFAALRYSSDEPLDDVTAPPYDVLSTADVDNLLKRHDHNIVAIDVPLDRDGPDRYELAARRLTEWIDAGVMTRDAGPSLTLYRMEFTDEAGRRRDTVGVIGALEVVDDGADGVLPHERTTPKAKTDRLDLTRATRCNLSPIWGLSLTAGLTDLLIEPAEPVGHCVDENGVVHRVERIVDPARLAAISAAVARTRC